MTRKNNESIFKTPKGMKIMKIAGFSLWRYLAGKPLVFNLNLNATNVCNQNCPMCNAVIVGKGTGVTITLDQFKKIYESLRPYRISSLTISGGEPSLVKDMPEIMEFSAKKFPFGVNVNSNLYASEETIRKFSTAALRNNIRIGTSFDGFGEVADRLRGAKNVSDRVTANIELVTGLRKELKSSSTLNVHTVVSDRNIHQVPDILDLSEKYGWTQTLAPVNNFFYQDSSDPDAPKLTYSQQLEDLIKLASSKKNIAVSKAFLTSIPKFIRGETDKYCPYLTGIFRTYKIFIEPNGDLSLCSREPIGNVLESGIEDILKTGLYRSDREKYTRCQGCWMACFVEILLAMPALYQKIIINKYT